MAKFNVTAAPILAMTFLAIFGVLVEMSPQQRKVSKVDPHYEVEYPKYDKTMWKTPKMAWYVVRNRTCPNTNDFCPVKLPPEGRAAGAIAGLTGIASALGLVQTGGDAVNGFIGGAISNLQGIGSLIREGVELAKIFGLGPKVNAILVDNRCPKCDLWVRCTSANKDTGYIPLEGADGYIVKFVTWLPGWEYGIGNFGLVFWSCEYKDDNTGKIIRLPAFGGSAPREMINLFEVRNRGLFRMDQETGRIDARQPYTPW